MAYFSNWNNEGFSCLLLCLKPFSIKHAITRPSITYTSDTFTRRKWRVWFIHHYFQAKLWLPWESGQAQSWSLGDMFHVIAIFLLHKFEQAPFLLHVSTFLAWNRGNDRILLSKVTWNLLITTFSKSERFLWILPISVNSFNYIPLDCWLSLNVFQLRRTNEHSFMSSAFLPTTEERLTIFTQKLLSLSCLALHNLSTQWLVCYVLSEKGWQMLCLCSPVVQPCSSRSQEQLRSQNTYYMYAGGSGSCCRLALVLSCSLTSFRSWMLNGFVSSNRK